MRKILNARLVHSFSGQASWMRLTLVLLFGILVGTTATISVWSAAKAQGPAPILIDFESNNGLPLSGGDVVTDITVDGLTVTIDVVSNGDVDQAMIFDSSAPTGTDEDLGTPNEACPGGGPGEGDGGAPGTLGENCTALGNVLIIQENPDGIPDDEQDGGTITFTFSEPIIVVHFDLIDFEETTSPEIVFLDAAGNQVGNAISPTGYGDNSYEEFNPAIDAGLLEVASSIVMTLPISGAVGGVDVVRAAEAIGTIGDTVWCDDGNGTFEAGEGIDDVTVSLSDDTGVISSTVTGPDGSYLFTPLPVGFYTVTVGALPVACNIPAVDPDPVLDSTSAVTIMPDALTNLDQDFAYVPLGPIGSIGDTVWCDDGNGTFEAGEGLDGITVSLSDVTGVISSTATGPDGNYLFAPLPLGTYTVTVGAVPASCNIPAVDPDDVLDSTSSTTLTIGTPNDLLQDFAFVPQGSLGDTVWCDDGNGTFEAGEGIDGITVSLSDATGVISSTTTGPDGNYLFIPLPLGTYTVTVGVVPAPCNIPTVDPDTVLDGSSTEILTSAEPNNLAQDFAYVPPVPQGSIGDTVWCDDGNDTFESGEGIDGVTVSLSDSTGVISSTTTGPDGAYLFSPLPLGAYTVTVGTVPEACNIPAVDPDDTLDSTSTAILELGAPVDLEQDFAFVPPPTAPLGSIGDTIFCDGNDNGEPDPNEGLAGVTVSLTNEAGETVDTQTDVNGVYNFPNLPLGEYTIAVSNLPELCNVPTVDPDGGNDNTSTVTLTSEIPDRPDQDFGYVAPPESLGSIGDTIFCDENASGTFDAGEGLSGITVTLSNAAGDAVGTATTGTDGAYNFPDLPLGIYTVSVINPPDSCNVPTVDPDDGNDNMSTVELTPAVPNNPDQDFGYVAPPPDPGSIGDTIFCDLNGNGTLDAGEGLEGVTVTLSGAANATTTTGADGTYLFPNLVAGDYTIAVNPADLPPSCNIPGVDPDDVNDNTSSVTLAEGEDNLDQDFGYLPIVDLALDKSASVSQIGPNQTFSFVLTVTNEGLNPATGVTVSDQLPDGLSFVSAEPAPGSYDAASHIWTIGNMAVGQSVNLIMTVRSTGDGPHTNIAQIATTDQPDRDSTPGNDVPGEDDQDQVTVGGGAESVSIGDYVWIDANADGLQSEGEIGIPGITVLLYNSDNVPVGEQQTGANGQYLFENYPPDSYSVEFQLPSGFGFTGQNTGSDDTVDSDVDPATNRTPSVSVPAGENLTFDAGVVEVVLAPNLTVNKVAETTEFIRGETIVYEIQYANTGNGVAEEVVLTEGVPPGTTFDASQSASGWACSPDGVCVLSVGDLAPDESGSVQFALRINEDLPAEVTQINCAVIISSANTPTGTSTSSTVTVTVRVPEDPTDIEEGVEPGVQLYFYIPLIAD